MESGNFSSWLSKKLYLISIGKYATIGVVMVLPGLFSTGFNIPLFWTKFFVYFLTLFLRAFYESMVVYEARIRDLSLSKMLTLVFITSSITSLISHFVKPKLGLFSIPVSIIIAMVVVAKLKTMLWPALRAGLFTKLPEKLQLNAFSMYGFYGFLVGITYFMYSKHNIWFYYAFAVAFFVAAIFEEAYNLVKLYDCKLDIKSLIPMVVWAAFCAISSSAVVWIMMKRFGYSGQPATIFAVILVKLIQPLGSRKFILLPQTT